MGSTLHHPSLANVGWPTGRLHPRKHCHSSDRCLGLALTEMRKKGSPTEGPKKMPCLSDCGTSCGWTTNPAPPKEPWNDLIFCKYQQTIVPTMVSFRGAQTDSAHPQYQTAKTLWGIGPTSPTFKMGKTHVAGPTSFSCICHRSDRLKGKLPQLSHTQNPVQELLNQGHAKN